MKPAVQVPAAISGNTNNLPKENLNPTNPKFFEKKPLSICKALIESFSTNHRKRHPSWANKQGRGGAQNHDNNQDNKSSAQGLVHIRLITIGPSHYCEKARWGLDLIESDPHSPYYYSEDAHPPVLASIATLEASNGQASMTPMIVFNDDDEDNSNDNEKRHQCKKVIYDSTNILQEFCPFLYPPTKRNDILQMESYLGQALGATLRVFFYYNFLKSEIRPKVQSPDGDNDIDGSKLKMLANIASSNSSSIEKWMFDKLLNKGIKQGLIKAMNISPESSKLSLKTIRDIFEEMSKRLELSGDGDSDGRTNSDHSKEIQTQKKKKYLMDTENQSYGFTAVDLTFAALAAPIIAPPEIKPFMEYREQLMPKELVALKYELRNTLAGQHVLDMYKHHRCCFHGNTMNANTTADTKGNYGVKKNQVVVPKLVGRDKIPLGVVLGMGAMAYSIFSFASNQKKGGANNRSVFHSRL